MSSVLQSLAPRWASVSVVVGAVIFFMGERITDGSLAVRGVAFALMLPALYVGLRALGKSEGHRRAGLMVLAAGVVTAAGAALYLGSAPTGDEARTTGQTVLLAAGIYLGVFGALATLALDLALVPMRIADVVQSRRLGAALAAVFVAVSALFTAAAFNYAAHKGKVRRDFALNAPTSPSESVRSLVLAADEPVEVFLFFERGSEALIEIKDYFDALAADGVKVVELDQALDPELAKELKVKKNGTVAVRYQKKSKTWFVGEKRTDARRKVKKIDKEIRTRLSQVTRDKVIVYTTAGHGERGTKKAKKGARDGVSILKQIAKSLNISLKKLGVAEGLAQQIPEDADVVMIIGANTPFLDAEVDALLAYLNNGGALFVLVEPQAETNLTRLYDALGVGVSGATLMNDKAFIARTKTAADYEHLFSVNFPNHPAVKTFSQARGEAGLIFRRSTSIEKKKVGKDHIQTAIARGHRDTFLDVNGNREFDPADEVRKVYDFAVAVEKPVDGEQVTRAIIVGDSDIMSDFMMDKQTHQVFAVESLFWLMRDDLAGGAMPETSDTPIDHTADEDKFWFYLTTMGAPLLVLLLGLLWVRMQTRRRRK